MYFWEQKKEGVGVSMVSVNRLGDLITPADRQALHPVVVLVQGLALQKTANIPYSSIQWPSICNSKRDKARPETPSGFRPLHCIAENDKKKKGVDYRIRATTSPDKQTDGFFSIRLLVSWSPPSPRLSPK